MNDGQPKQKLTEIKRKIVIYGERETVAHVASILPVSYAILHRILSEVKLRCPDMLPNTVLDYGSGPATGLWYISHKRDVIEGSSMMFGDVKLGNMLG